MQIAFYKGPAKGLTNKLGRLLEWFWRHRGDHYDWMGVLRFALPFLRQRPGKWFCSEAVAEALGMADSAGVTPGDLWSIYKEGRPA